MIANIFISIAVGLVTIIAGYNYIPLSFLEKFAPQSEPILGATITNIAATDTIRDSRAVINTNFTNLNTDKIEAATTSVGNITTLPNLVSIGTITTGVWNGTAITVTYGGTGSTTLASNRVLLGNGTGIMRNVVDGSSGQFLTNQGVGIAPTWTTSSVDQALNYTWTGFHNFNAGATSTMATSTVSFHTPLLTVSSSTIGQLGMGYFNATSTSATSTIIYGLNVGATVRASAFNGTSTATSTFGGGFKLTTGCFETIGGCLGGGYETITTTFDPGVDDGDGTKTGTATCSAGKRVIAGGYDLTGADVTSTTFHMVVQSAPVAGNSWVVKTRCKGGTCSPTTGAVAYAICINN